MSHIGPSKILGFCRDQKNDPSFNLINSFIVEQKSKKLREKNEKKKSISYSCKNFILTLLSSSKGYFIYKSFKYYL